MSLRSIGYSGARRSDRPALFLGAEGREAGISRVRPHIFLRGHRNDQAIPVEPKSSQCKVLHGFRLICPVIVCDPVLGQHSY